MKNKFVNNKVNFIYENKLFCLLFVSFKIAATKPTLTEKFEESSRGHRDLKKLCYMYLISQRHCDDSC